MSRIKNYGKRSIYFLKIFSHIHVQGHQKLHEQIWGKEGMARAIY